MERQLDIEQEEVATDWQMYITQNNRQIERLLDREEEEEEVATDRQMYTTQKIESRRRQLQIGRCIHHRTIGRQIDSYIEKMRRKVQIVVYNIEQQRDREIVRQKGGGGSYRQIDVYKIEQQIEKRDSQIERRRWSLQIDRCIQHNRTINRQIVRMRGGGGSYRRIDVYNIEQYIDREIVRQRGGGGSYRQIDVFKIEQQIERKRQLDREEEVATDRQMYTTWNKRQIERQLDREEKEEVGTDSQMYTTQNKQ